MSGHASRAMKKGKTKTLLRVVYLAFFFYPFFRPMLLNLFRRYFEIFVILPSLFNVIKVTQLVFAFLRVARARF